MFLFAHILTVVPIVTKLPPGSTNHSQMKGDLPLMVLDLMPVFRTSPNMISDEGKGKEDVEERAHRSGDDRALKQLEAGRKAEDVAREVGVSKHTIYAWKAKYGGMDVSEAQEAKQLRDENARLKKWWWI